MHSKRVLIITQTLGGNYGGIMQAYALQAYLRQLGVEAVTAGFEYNIWLIRLKAHIKYWIRLALHSIIPRIHDLPPEIDRYQRKNTLAFVGQHIRRSDTSKSMRQYAKNFDALIVGSDQVWRSVYADMDKTLLAFAEDMDVKKLSYAASFGKDDLSEYDQGLLNKSARLAKKFDAISVREDSGVDLVADNWGVTAEQHVDPTFLLDKTDYLQLIKAEGKLVHPLDGNLFPYVLDSNGMNGEVISRVEEYLGLQRFDFWPPKPTTRKELFSQIDQFQLPRVTQWLKCFSDAEFVITDSFHGTAFSIIFNKPFIVVANTDRGAARFTSVLSVFGLEDRLVSNVAEVTPELLRKKIDWKSVNAKLNRERRRSEKYLRQHLEL
jgi:hypothetical protein